MPTLVVKRLIKPGYEREYEQGLARMIDEAEELDGYLGANIARPGNKKHPLYIYSIKFDTRKHLEAYKNSPLRQQLLKEWHEQSQRPIDERTLRSIDWWFIVPGGPAEVPRYKMVLISIFAAYPVVLLLSIMIDKPKNIESAAVNTLVLVLVTIFIMSYVTVPLFLNILRNWLQEN